MWWVARPRLTRLTEEAALKIDQLVEDLLVPRTEFAWSKMSLLGLAASKSGQIVEYRLLLESGLSLSVFYYGEQKHIVISLWENTLTVGFGRIGPVHDLVEQKLDVERSKT